MEELIERAKTLAIAPFTPDRSSDLPSLRSVATELGTTVIRVRKLLITADYFASPTASAVQKMVAEGKTVDEICTALHLKPSAVYGYLPYEVRPYNLPETTANADRHKRYRATRKLQGELENNGGVFDGKVSMLLWRCVVIFQNYPFTTLGRGKDQTGSVEFTYTVSAEGKSGGRHYEGESVDGEFSGGKTPPFRRSGNRDSGRLENVVPVMRKPLRVLFDRLFTAGYPA